MRLSVSILLGLVTAAVLVTQSVESHHVGAVLDYLPTWAQNQVQQRGYGLYRLDTVADRWPGVRDSLRRVYEDEYSKTGIPWIEVGFEPPGLPQLGLGTYDLLYAMPDSWSFPGAIGLAYYTSAPARIELNRFAGISVWDSTTGHEHGHIDGQEDLYIHPLTCDPTRRWTRMSCGTFIGTMQVPYDRDVVLNVWIPDLPSWAEAKRLNATTVRVSYTGIRMAAQNCVYDTVNDLCGGHFNRTLDNATRVAVFRSVNGGPWVWIGYGPRPQAGGIVSVDVTDDPGVDCNISRARYAIRPESALETTFLGRTPYLSGDLYEMEVK